MGAPLRRTGWRGAGGVAAPLHLTVTACDAGIITPALCGLVDPGGASSFYPLTTLDVQLAVRDQLGHTYPLCHSEAQPQRDMIGIFTGAQAAHVSATLVWGPHHLVFPLFFPFPSRPDMVPFAARRFAFGPGSCAPAATMPSPSCASRPTKMHPQAPSSSESPTMEPSLAPRRSTSLLRKVRPESPASTGWYLSPARVGC